jgi:hypothetical protein
VDVLRVEGDGEENGERENLDAHRVTVCSRARGGGKGTRQAPKLRANTVQAHAWCPRRRGGTCRVIGEGS